MLLTRLELILTPTGLKVSPDGITKPVTTYVVTIPFVLVVTNVCAVNNELPPVTSAPVKSKNSIVPVTIALVANVIAQYEIFTPAA